MQKKLLVCSAVFVLAAVAGWLLPAPEAGARPAFTHTTYFYSDASFSELVGTRELDCYGHLHTWGVVTEYRETYSFSCSPWPGGVIPEDQIY
ncbi:MAG TPA: DUF6289 family protein [Thermoanaerobaculia bacterium]|nr:DUF6289 family protein [Thermoanaerobaculia bacterium]